MENFPAGVVFTRWNVTALTGLPTVAKTRSPFILKTVHSAVSERPVQVYMTQRCSSCRGRNTLQKKHWRQKKCRGLQIYVPMVMLVEAVSFLRSPSLLIPREIHKRLIWNVMRYCRTMNMIKHKKLEVYYRNLKYKQKFNSLSFNKTSLIASVTHR